MPTRPALHLTHPTHRLLFSRDATAGTPFDFLNRIAFAVQKCSVLADSRSGCRGGNPMSYNWTIAVTLKKFNPTHHPRSRTAEMVTKCQLSLLFAQVYSSFGRFPARVALTNARVRH